MESSGKRLRILKREKEVKFAEHNEEDLKKIDQLEKIIDDLNSKIDEYEQQLNLMKSAQKCFEEEHRFMG